MCQSLVLGPWSLVLGPWSLVLGPWSLVLGPWSVLGPLSCLVPGPWFLASQRTLKAPRHPADGVAQFYQLLRFGITKIIPSLRGVVARSDLSVRGSRVSQKLQELLVTMSHKSLTDVVHHRDARAVQLTREFGI